MDKFILNNDTWLRYLPIIMYGLVIIIIALSIAIAFLIYRRYKNQNLKSRKRKSPFAMSYADCFVPNAASSAPLKRNVAPEPETHFAHVQQPATPIPDRPVQEQESSVIEFYFQYEDEYKI